MSESPRSPSRFPGGIPQGAQGADLVFYTIADRYLDDSMRAYPTGSPAWSDRLASLLSRMQQVPRFLSDARANLQNPPRVITDMVIHTNAGSITFFERTAPILFARAPALAPRLERENARVLEALR